MQTDVSFKQWAIVELMGHTKVAGLVTEAEVFGGKLMRVDIPGPDGDIIASQYFSAASIYRLTPVTEEVARHVAGNAAQEPPAVWDLRQAVKRELLLEAKEESRPPEVCGCPYNNCTCIDNDDPEDF